MTTVDDGTLETGDDGQPRLRFERRFPHPIAKVWRALTDAAELSGWFPQRVRFDPDLRVGAKVHYSDDPNLPDQVFHGEVLAYEPPVLLELTWGTDVLRMELRADGDGTTLLFTDTFATEEGSPETKAARDGAGWHLCLGHLVLVLDGEPVPPFAMDAWEALHSRYVARFGAA